MIKAAILGADSPDGGELIRLLAMHPDVDIVALQAPGLEGKPVVSRHHGLIGETSAAFTASVDYSRCDVIFVCPGAISCADFMRLRVERPDLKVISLDEIPGVDKERAGIVYGLPEINRKLLVRGASAAVLPMPLASMALVALFPLAKHLLLSGDIKIEADVPKSILDAVDRAALVEEVEKQLREVQQSFAGKVTFDLKVAQSRRSVLMHIDCACPVNLEQLLALYDIYDDHRFSFVTTYPVGVSEVAGTNKCVVSVSKPSPERALLGVAADCRLRGASGEAVHVMNLMFGLHEKTGLALKAIDFNPVDTNPIPDAEMN